jgi:hypothetical protein
MTDVNKTIMRCLVKNLAMFGLGIKIYSGEDLPLKESDFLTEEEKVLTSLATTFHALRLQLLPVCGTIPLIQTKNKAS